MSLKNNEITRAVNRGIPCESGLCMQCRMDCKGQCEVFLSSTRGRKMLYTQEPVGTVTYGSNNMQEQAISYNALKIQGRLIGVQNSNAKDRIPQQYLTPNVDVSTEFGNVRKTKCLVPLNMGAALNVVGRYWNSYAYAAALMGYTLVIGENAMNMDPGLEIRNGKVISSPRTEKMVEAFLRYDQGYGGVIVQLNYDDIYNDNQTLDYICRKYGNKIIIEIKIGQGGKCINGEAVTEDIQKAVKMRQRYPVYPDPLDPKVQEEWRNGKIKRFTRYSCVPFTEANDYQEAEEQFVNLVKHIREQGVERVFLKTAGFSLDGVAASLKLGSRAKIDLITFDGSGGGTAHSPWPMMEHWGIPSLMLHARVAEYAAILRERGERVPDLSFAGGFSGEDHILKALALGAPFTKTVTMCRALIIPGAVGSNIEGVLHPDRKALVNGMWDELPASIAALGNTPEQIFDAYLDVQNKVGRDEMKNLPYGTIANWCYVDKMMTGLRQLMSGLRVFSLKDISREDIAAINQATADITGIPLITDAYEEQAMKILLE